MYSKIAVHEKLLLFDSAELGSKQDKDIKRASEFEFCLLECGQQY